MLDHVSAVALQHKHRPSRQLQSHGGFEATRFGFGDVLAEQYRFFGAERQVAKGPQEVVMVHYRIERAKDAKCTAIKVRTSTVSALNSSK